MWSHPPKTLQCEIANSAVKHSTTKGLRPSLPGFCNRKPSPATELLAFVRVVRVWCHSPHMPGKGPTNRTIVCDLAGAIPAPWTGLLENIRPAFFGPDFVDVAEVIICLEPPLLVEPHRSVREQTAVRKSQIHTRTALASKLPGNCCCCYQSWWMQICISQEAAAWIKALQLYVEILC